MIISSDKNANQGLGRKRFGAPEAWVVDDVIQRKGIVRRVLSHHNPVRAIPRQEIRVDDVESVSATRLLTLLGRVQQMRAIAW